MVLYLLPFVLLNQSVITHFDMLPWLDIHSSFNTSSLNHSTSDLIQYVYMQNAFWNKLIDILSIWMEEYLICIIVKLHTFQDMKNTKLRKVLKNRGVHKEFSKCIKESIQFMLSDVHFMKSFWMVTPEFGRGVSCRMSHNNYCTVTSTTPLTERPSGFQSW